MKGAQVHPFIRFTGRTQQESASENYFSFSRQSHLVREREAEMGGGGAEVPQGADPSGRHADRSQGERVNQGEAVQGELQLSTRPRPVETDNDRRAQVVKLFAAGAAAFLFVASFVAILECLPGRVSLSFFQSFPLFLSICRTNRRR